MKFAHSAIATVVLCAVAMVSAQNAAAKAEPAKAAPTTATRHNKPLVQEMKQIIFSAIR